MAVKLLLPGDPRGSSSRGRWSPSPDDPWIQPLAELSLSERSEDSAVNRALRARIRRKLEAVKQEATQLPRLNSLGRRESVLSTYGILHLLNMSLRYGRSKGVRERRQEEPPLGSLAVPCHPEKVLRTISHYLL